MSFVARTVSTLLRRSNPCIFTRNFGVEFKIHSLASDETTDVEVEKGTNLLEVCQAEGIEITAVCSGGGSCGSCHIILPQELFDSLPPMHEQEKEILGNIVFGSQPTSRLACRVKVSEKMEGKTINVALPL